MKKYKCKAWLGIALCIAIVLTLFGGVAFAGEEPESAPTAQESQSVPEGCALTEGCVLEAGHEGECDATPVVDGEEPEEKPSGEPDKTTEPGSADIPTGPTMFAAPAPLLAANSGDTAEDAATFTFKPGTTNEEIIAAWGEGAASIAANGDGTYTVTLLKNIGMGQGQNINFGEYSLGAGQPRMILDLNGKTITGPSIVIANLGNLTIKGSGSVIYSGGQYLAAVNNAGYNLTIEGGTFACNGAGSAAYNAAISTTAGATTEINGGTFNGGAAGAVISYGETIVNGGTLEGKYGVVAKVTGDGNEGSITFPEGSTAAVNAEAMPFVVQGQNGKTGSITVAGGTSTGGSILGTLGTVEDKTSALAVTGGTHEANPTDYVPAGEDNTVAKFTAAGTGETAYVVGAEGIGQKAASAASGDEINILSGDVNLSGMPDGITVKNEGGGEVAVNGSAVAAGDEIITHTHHAVRVDAKEATAIEPGNIEYWYCPDCGKYFRDEALAQEVSLADTVIPATGEPQPVEKDIYYQCPTTGVTLHADTTAVPEGARLVVQPVAETDAAYADAKELLKDKAGKFVLYDITLVDAEGNAIQPEGPVVVGIPVPEGYDTAKLAVHRINDDKTTAEYGVTEDKGMAYIQTEHFSKYALAEKGSMTEAGGQAAGGTETPSTAGTPKTGDTADMAPYILLAVAAGTVSVAGTVVVVRKRRHCEK